MCFLFGPVVSPACSLQSDGDYMVIFSASVMRGAIFPVVHEHLNTADSSIDSQGD